MAKHKRPREPKTKAGKLIKATQQEGNLCGKPKPGGGRCGKKRGHWGKC